MSDIELEPASSSSESGSKNFRTSHVYDDGNIQLDVRGTLFKVHKSILAMHSETFHDMFSLPQVHPATDSQSEPVTLDDSPLAFDKLMDAAYKGVEFLRDTPVHEYLDVIELTQKYQMHALERNLQRHIVSLLPSSTADVLAPSWRGFTQYRKHPSLARTVLRSGAKELWPWAFYFMGTRMILKIDVDEKSAYDPPPVFLTLDSTFAYSLLVLLQLIRRALMKWDQQISDFYSTGCPQASGAKTTGPRCSRNGRRFDNTSPLYIDILAGKNRVYIVGVMTKKIRYLTGLMEAEDDNDYGRWCTKCKNSLKRVVRNIVLEFYQGLVECTDRLDRSRL